MNCEQLKDIIKEDPTTVLVDVRTQHEYEQSRIKSAILVPIDHVVSKMDWFKDKKVLMYCRSGSRSQSAVNFLKQHGINAINIGGINSYIGCIEY
jgi:rhodanese-related sulfurtransferase